jgi:predicted TIM-barrel fold metal-dependent hydrolase
MIDFYDAHSHKLEDQKGGFLIALENEQIYKDVITNQNVLSFQDKSRLLFAVEYITRHFQSTQTEIIKYHPQREGYTPEEVTVDLLERNPKICIVDTLNQPYWSPSDYWKLVKLHRKTQFVLAHSGGWDIMEFIRIAVIEPNVWIDFSWTQEYFGWCGCNPRYQNIIHSINYGFNYKRTKGKILFGSDNPFYSQKCAVEKYMKLPGSEDFLKKNFFKLLEISNI